MLKAPKTEYKKIGINDMEGFHVAILSGSPSDEKIVKEVKNYLRTYWIRDIDEVLDCLNHDGQPVRHVSTKSPTFEWRITSAHRNDTSKVFEDYQDKNNVLYITRLTLSDALSGNAAAQGFGHPVIACPGKPSDPNYTSYLTSTVDCPKLVAPMFAYTPGSATLNTAKIVCMGKWKTYSHVCGAINQKPKKNDKTELRAVIISEEKSPPKNKEKKPNSEIVSDLLRSYDRNKKVKREILDIQEVLKKGIDFEQYARGTIFLLSNPKGEFNSKIKDQLQSSPYPVLICQYGISPKNEEEAEKDTFLYIHKRPENLALAAATIFGTYDKGVWMGVNVSLLLKSDSNMEADKDVRSTYRKHKKPQKKLSFSKLSSV
jgi:phosphoribosylcarboxyaminoimidazole (NCAIR) mutase